MARNLPRGWVLPDAAIHQLAQSRPRTREQLSRADAVPPGTAARAADELLTAIAAAAGDAPPRDAVETGRPGAEELRLEKALQKELAAIAGELAIQPEILATRRELAALSRGARELPVLAGRRRDVEANDCSRCARRSRARGGRRRPRGRRRRRCGEQPLLRVVIDERLRLLAIDREAPPHRLLVVVRAAGTGRGARRRAGLARPRRVRLDVEARGRSACTCAGPQAPLEHARIMSNRTTASSGWPISPSSASSPSAWTMCAGSHRG